MMYRSLSPSDTFAAILLLMSITALQAQDAVVVNDSSVVLTTPLTEVNGRFDVISATGGNSHIGYGGGNNYFSFSAEGASTIRSYEAGVGYATVGQWSAGGLSVLADATIDGALRVGGSVALGDSSTDTATCVGRLQVMPGTVGSPGIRGSADPDTGIQIGSDLNEGALVAGGTQVMTWDPSGVDVKGGVGIGGVLEVAAGVVSLADNNVGGAQQTIADDSVAEFLPPRFGGFASITVGGDSVAPSGAHSGIIYFDVGSSLSIEKGDGWASLGSQLDVMTGNVTGTTGVDGNLTVAVQGGVLKVENRTGAAQTVQVTYQ